MSFTGERPYSQGEARENALVHRILQLGVPELERLHRLRALGWQDEGMDGHFKQQRDFADNATDQANRAWFNKMKIAFGELDDFASIVPPNGSFNFLDLGCCPGGFSSYVLRRNQEATGVGISLPVEQGGHRFTLERAFRPRYTVHFADLLYYDLQRTPTGFINGKRLSPLPPGMVSLDLIMLDGHQLRTYISPSMEDAEAWDRQRLLVAQLVIALRAVKQGGTIVVKLSRPDKADTAQLLFFLDHISVNLCTRKPRIIHANRGTFYAIAQGVGLGRRGQTLSQYRARFEDLWYEVGFGGEEGKGRFLSRDDLDFIITQDELHQVASLERLVEFGRDPWNVQGDALERWFQRKGLL